MLESLDAIIATGSIVLGLSLVVQAVQQIIKQWFDLKSNYMRLQLLSMFDPSPGGKDNTMAGMRTVSSLVKGADNKAKAVVEKIEGAFRNFGYKDLELLEHVDTRRFKDIVKTIDWKSVSVLHQAGITAEHINKDIALWFDLAKKAYQDLYERRMKLWSFILSAIIVIALDANLFRVYHDFTVNAPLRDAAIVWAEKSVSAHGALTAKDSAGMMMASTDSVRSVVIRAQVDSVRTILAGDGFQTLGWRSNSFLSTTSQGWVWNWLAGFFGWVAMTLLVSLGAPFWYDLLKTLMGVKETLKNRKAGPQ